MSAALSDSEGGPLIGVNELVKGINIGTTGPFDGIHQWDILRFNKVF